MSHFHFSEIGVIVLETLFWMSLICPSTLQVSAVYVSITIDDKIVPFQCAY